MEKTMSTQKENKMGIMPINKLLLTMSIPMIISMLVQALYNVVDSIFVAQIGENALTAVSLAFPVQNLMIAVSVGTGVGVNAYLSRNLGAKNFEVANKTADNGIFLSFLSYLLFAVFGMTASGVFFASQTTNQEIITMGGDYTFIVCTFSLFLFGQIIFNRLLQATGKTFYQFISQSIAAGANIILDPILIFGWLGFPALGVKGAAIATVFSQFIGMCLALYFNLKKNHEIKISFKGFKPDIEIIGKIYSVGIPSIIMGSIGSIMTYFMNRILISFTTTATAVFGVYFKLQSFVFMPVFGLNNGMVPIVAYNFGARKRERITKTIKLSILYAVGMLTIGAIVMMLFPEELLKMFNATEMMLSLGIPALRTIAISFFAAGFSIISLSVFQALGHGMLSLEVSIIRQLIVLLPSAWLLSKTGNVNNVWWAFPISEVASFTFSMIFMKRVYNKEIKNLNSVEFEARPAYAEE
jgi:putative MATE family efflux protein